MCKPILGKEKYNSCDCFRTAIMIPLLELDTLPPKLDKIRMLLRKGVGKGSQDNYSFRWTWTTFPWTMAWRYHLHLLDPNSQNKGLPRSSCNWGNRAAALVCSQEVATSQSPSSPPPLPLPIISTHTTGAEPSSLLHLPKAVPSEEASPLFTSLFPLRPKKRRV